MALQPIDFEALPTEKLLRWSMDQYGLEAGLASSFGLEDMVLIDMIAKLDGPLTIFTLDTGRLHEETYDLMERVRSKYGLKIKTYFPNQEKIESLVRGKGFFSFRESVDNRKECCYIRKVEPLNRALGELKAWITGLRRSQGVTRTNIAKVIEDTDHPPLIKINPLAEWTETQVLAYITENNVPINILHKRNYPSIGCAPCTRAIEKGEDIRAGRWWWENPEHKECGLHNQPNKQ